MKVLSAILVPGVLALAISTAKADPSPNPETSGAQTMPSGAEPSSPPPATYDPGTPGVAPGATTTTTTPNTTDTAGSPGSTTTTTTPGGTTTTTTPNTDTAGAPATTPSTTDTPTAPAPAAPSSTDDMNAATPPAGTPATPTPAPAGNGATNMAIPPPPNGQTTESVPVAPLPPMPGAPEGVYPSAVLVPSHVGVGLLVGGGFQDFVDNGIKNVTGDGGYWTARMVAGTREYVGVEAAYVGDARSIAGLGLNSNSRLVSNGLTGNLRLNIPVMVGGGASLLEPFGFVGVGWSHYQITNNNAQLSDFISRDDVLTLPYGGGLEFGYRGFLADARFTYTQTYFNNLTSTVGGNLNNWGVGGQIGFEF
ncbi:MAG TPA: hypothetical protein VN853_17350 [Polyangia bacterium]|jgi:hypothetical protein|nr:hypothetical protein [Polyangia bacterium]